MSFKYRDKVKLKKDIFKTLFDIKDVVSVTLVGSFWEKKITDIESETKKAIILGSENRGIRRLIKEKCDFLVKIPMLKNDLYFGFKKPTNGMITVMENLEDHLKFQVSLEK